jgi:hypothetical protein
LQPGNENSSQSTNTNLLTISTRTKHKPLFYSFVQKKGINMALITNFDHAFYLEQMVELTAEEIVFRERLASLAAEAVTRAHTYFLDKKEIRWTSLKRHYVFKEDNGYEDKYLFRRSLFHDDEVKRAKAQLRSAKFEAKHQARMVRVKNVELERHVDQLNAYRRRNT